MMIIIVMECRCRKCQSQIIDSRILILLLLLILLIGVKMILLLLLIWYKIPLNHHIGQQIHLFPMLALLVRHVDIVWFDGLE